MSVLKVFWMNWTFPRRPQIKGEYIMIHRFLKKIFLEILSELSVEELTTNKKLLGHIKNLEILFRGVYVQD